MAFTTGYNKARLAAESEGRKLSVADYRGSLNAPSSNVNAPTPSPVNTIRDVNKETQVATSKLGMNQAEIAQLADNPIYQKRLFEMTYTPEQLKGIKEYQTLQSQDAEKKGLQGQMGQIRQNAPNAMLALEDALRTKQDVGKQQLGESELFQKAGLEGYFTLGQSMNEQSKLMEDRYGSFINALSRAGQYQTNQYNALAGQYKNLTDEYNTKAKEMNTILTGISEYQRGIDLAEKDLQNKKELIAWQTSLEDSGISAYGGIAPIGGFRTDRHNNPTAFTTAVAQQAGLVEGVDYVVGDAFPDNPNLFTARLIGTPEQAIDTTIKLIDNIGFQTAKGQPRWTYINMNNAEWNALDKTGKENVIKGMYQHEGGSGVLFGEGNATLSYTPKDGESESDFDRRLTQQFLTNIGVEGFNAKLEINNMAQAMNKTPQSVYDLLLGANWDEPDKATQPGLLTPYLVAGFQAFPDMFQNPTNYPGLENIDQDYSSWKQTTGEGIDFNEYKLRRLLFELHQSFGGMIPYSALIKKLQEVDGGNLIEQLGINLKGWGDESEREKLVKKMETFQNI